MTTDEPLFTSADLRRPSATVVVPAKWLPCSMCGGVDVLVVIDYPDDAPRFCADCIREYPSETRNAESG